MAIRFETLDRNQLEAIRAIAGECDRRKKANPDDLSRDEQQTLQEGWVDFTVRISGFVRQGDPTTAYFPDWERAVRCLLAEMDSASFRRAMERLRNKRKNGVRQSSRFAKIGQIVQRLKIVHRSGSIRLNEAQAGLLEDHAQQLRQAAAEQPERFAVETR